MHFSPKFGRKMGVCLIVWKIWYMICGVCPESIQPCAMKTRDSYWRRHKIQETLYVGQWCLSSFQSRHLGTSHSSPNCHQLPHCIFLKSHQWSEISSLSKVILVLGEAKSWGRQIWTVGGWVTWVIWCFLKTLCIRCDAWAGTLSWWSCQSPVSHSLHHQVKFPRRNVQA